MMKRKYLLVLLAFISFSATGHDKHQFSLVKNDFLLDGKLLQKTRMITGWRCSCKKFQEDIAEADKNV